MFFLKNSKCDVVVCMCRSELENILEWLQWAKAAYKRDQRSLASVLRVIFFCAKSVHNYLLMSYWFVLIDSLRAMVCLIRVKTDSGGGHCDARGHIRCEEACLLYY